MGPDFLENEFGTNRLSGLTSAQAREKLNCYGSNKLMEFALKPWYFEFLDGQIGFFPLLLWLASFLCFFRHANRDNDEDASFLVVGVVIASVTFLTGCV